MKGKDILSVWDEASIHEIFHQTGLVDNNLPYKVKFENFVNGKLRSTFYKRLGLKHIAYFKPATIRLQVGTRVIGKYFLLIYRVIGVKLIHFRLTVFHELLMAL